MRLSQILNIGPLNLRRRVLLLPTAATLQQGHRLWPLGSLLAPERMHDAAWLSGTVERPRQHAARWRCLSPASTRPAGTPLQSPGRTSKQVCFLLEKSSTKGCICATAFYFLPCRLHCSFSLLLHRLPTIFAGINIRDASIETVSAPCLTGAAWSM